MASRSFFSPRSTVNAITSQPWSLSHLIATEVSSPPEYASTNFLSDIGQKLFERSRGAPLAEDGDDRVVARHRAGEARQSGLVNAAGHQVGGARWGLDHRHRRNQLDGENELANQGRGDAVAGAGPDQSELLDVTRDRGLRRAQPAPRQPFGDLLLRVHRASVDEGEDGSVPFFLGGCHFRTSCIVRWARSMCSAVTIRGGTKRIEWSSTALTTSRASRQACWNALARGSANSTACMRPRPRTSLPPRVWIAAFSISPISAAWPTSRSRSMTFSTARAAAHASGLPPNVDPWSPGSNTSALGAARTAPIGTPPPRPLASVITSGVMPWCWCANHRPVRPSPVCTSSRISSKPWSSHHLRTPSRYPRLAGTMPISPMTGSSITAAVCAPVAAWIASRSL